MSKAITVLTGGVGGAKLVLGLCAVVPPDAVTAIVNTGDDFRHFGLHISPDIDTLLYTLSGQSNAAQGWGRAGETWSFMEVMRTLGGEDWFNLGDGDLAVHVLRTAMLSRGDSHARVTGYLAQRWNIAARVSPMSDAPVATKLATEEGELDFQHYFVKRQCKPMVSEVRYDGAGEARAAPGVVDAIHGADAVLIAPSNPYLSIAPILAIPEIREALQTSSAPRIAVSPIIGGKAIKGPTTKLMRELGAPASNRSIAQFYAGLIDGVLIDESDADPDCGVAVAQTDILMRSLDDKKRVALAALALAARLAKT